MVEVGIPVYKARDTLPAALDSLVSQTKKNFLVCLSIDGDDENYDDIIEEYRRRGLHIRVIVDENGGPGMARQRVLDTTQCEYLMFLDADDMFAPRAIEVMFNAIHQSNTNIGRSSFIRENNAGDDQIIQHNASTITWFHGKIYRVSYLRDSKIEFLPGLRTDEDAYFNLVAWNGTDKRIETAEVTYIWRYNKNSLTRQNDHATYFANTYLAYVRSQVCGLAKLYDVRPDTSKDLIMLTLINIYYYYMEARYRNLPLEPVEYLVSLLRPLPWVGEFLTDINNWGVALQNLKTGTIFDKEVVVFFKEPFNEWVLKLIGPDSES